MKLLAVDEGSKATGLAFFQDSDRPSWTARLLPAEDWPWRRRMRYQADQLRRVFDIHDLGGAQGGVDVIAMEGAVTSAKNPRMGVKVGECRGYWLAHFDAIYGLEIPVLEIPPGKVRAAVGLSMMARRARSKDRYRQVALYLGLDAGISEDEADAACVGLAALAQLREQSWKATAR